MSLGYEQCRALKHTREFLFKLLALEDRDIKEGAHHCLHHFPLLNEHGKPMFSEDQFTNEDGSMNL